MSSFLIGLLSALVATNQPAAVSNLLAQTTGIAVKIPDPNDPVEKEYRQLMTDDDAALDEVDHWIQENNAFKEKGGGSPPDVLNARIRARFAPIRKTYDDFLKVHPEHARAHLAYGSFLEDSHDEEAAIAEYEKARQIDPKNPAAWNQLANHFVHDGPVKQAFEYYAKCIELDPTEPLYYRNLGNTVYLFRKAAGEVYGIDEQQVFTKALGLLQQAAKLDPTNFEVAQDLAETYYGIKPVRTDDALAAWSNALKVAGTDEQKEGVYVHLARFNYNADRFTEAHQYINMVTNPIFDTLKTRLMRNLTAREQKLAGTNAAPENVETNNPDPGLKLNIPKSQ